MKNDKFTKESLLGIVALLVIIVIGLVYNLNKDEEKTYSSAQVVEKAIELDSNDQIVDEMRLNFMSGCFDGANYEFCDCAFEAMLSKYGAKRFMEISVDYLMTEELEDSVLETMVQCI